MVTAKLKNHEAGMRELTFEATFQPGAPNFSMWLTSAVLESLLDWLRLQLRHHLGRVGMSVLRVRVPVWSE